MIEAKHIQQLIKEAPKRFDERYMPLYQLVDLLRSNWDGKEPSPQKVQRFLVESKLTVYPLTATSWVLSRKQVYKYFESIAIHTVPKSEQLITNDHG